MTRVILLFAGVIFWMITSAQTPHYRFNHLQDQHGLSNNHITAIIKDPAGYLWFGTPTGLNRYDGQKVNVFQHNIQDPGSIHDSNITALFMGPQNKLWIKANKSLSIYDEDDETFHYVSDRMLAAYGLPPGEVLNMLQDASGNYWFLHEKGLYRYKENSKTRFYAHPAKGIAITDIALSAKQNEMHYICEDGAYYIIEANGQQAQLQQAITAQLKQKKANFKLFIDQDGDSWVFASNMPLGAYEFRHEEGQAQHYTTTNPELRLNTDLISSIIQDDNGHIWLATDHGGIYVVNKKQQHITQLLHRDTDSYSLAQNAVLSLYKDRQGIIWVGTYKQGLSYYNKYLLNIPVFNQASGLPFEDVNRFAEDENGNLFIGTNGGGLLYFDRKKQNYKSYLHDPADNSSIGSNIIVSMLLDKRDRLWVGTYYGGLNRFDGKQFIRYQQNPQDPNSLDNSIWEIFEDSKGQIWVGTLSKGLFKYNSSRDLFERINNPAIPRYISAIMEDQQGLLWIGTAEGIVVIDQQGRTHERFLSSAQSGTLSNNYITDILQDKKKQIWISTQNGLNRYQPEHKDFLVYHTENGLPDNVVQALLEDQAGDIWASTLKGLVCLQQDPQFAPFKVFTTKDGLQALSFNENAAFKTHQGDLVFGGANGFNIISPANMPKAAISSAPILTGFELFNRSVEIGEENNGRKIVKKALAKTQSLYLRHDENVFSLRYGALDFLFKDHMQYRYKLAGFNDSWLPDGGNKKATFTNLDPGDYTFLLQSSLPNGEWSDAFEMIDIHIAPPFWKTYWAYSLYLMLFGGTLLLVRHIEKQRQHTRYLLRQEREEMKGKIELEQLKTQFFTNISHDFRTPLSLILSPIETMLQKDSQNREEQVAHLTVMKRNAKRLLNLVNQLLDFKKIDKDRLLNLQLADVVQQAADAVQSFSDMARRREITLSFHSQKASLYTVLDHAKIERMLFNLLGNAFKFTPSKGEISVTLSFDECPQPYNLQLSVRDNGLGIAKEAQSRVFERYYQQSNVHANSYPHGSGIGLAIVKEYTQLMNGWLNLKSEPDKGSTFTITLPFQEHASNCQAISNADAALVPLAKLPVKAIDASAQPAKATAQILLVDDDEELLYYLSQQLNKQFTVERASNSAEAWTKVLSKHPDLVLSDIEMAGGSGIALCKKIKQDQRTRHIPVILLTAYANQHMQLSGATNGASDYITKPFNLELLTAKIQSQLKQKSNAEKTYKKQLDLTPDKITIESEDERFLRKATQIIEKNLDQSDLSVAALAKELCMSRVGLYKRVLALSGHTPTEFIRNIRLRKAAQLLTQSRLSVAEVAYQVGFSDPKQFSRHFKSVYQVLPSTYKQTHH